MSNNYRYALALTSQFPFCAIPLRLDTYSKCQFACRYCFAAARGGAGGDAKIQLADLEAIERRLDRLETKGPKSVLDELLLKRIPIHFGGMSDPFMPLELSARRSLETLKILRKYKYPTIISTKSTIFERDEYLAELTAGHFAVQVSISIASDPLSILIDAGAPSTSRRLRALAVAARAGVPTAVRHQPLFPRQDIGAVEIIHMARDAGARHVAVEHLKLPVERSWSHRDRLESVFGFSLEDYYRTTGAQRDGREWVLPVSDRVPRIAMLRRETRGLGMSFGAADTDLLHLSDGDACCSGADLLGMGSGLRHNFLSAVKSGLKSGRIEYRSISEEWAPQRPINEFVNSRSRDANGKLGDYIRRRWNGVSNGPSPQSFYAVGWRGDYDEQGNAIYDLDLAMIERLS